MRFRTNFIGMLILLSSCSSLKKGQETVLQKKPILIKQDPYFIIVPITKYSSIQSPCVDVEIDDCKISMEVDLGYWGNLSIVKELADCIPNKTFICEKSMYGVRGKQYPTSLYRIPRLKIARMTFLNPILQQETLEFIKDSTFIQNGGKPAIRDPGRLGWELFRKVNLLIDIQDSKIGFCDSLDTLKSNGYFIRSFAKVPLLIDRGLIEFEAEVFERGVRCMLDTGATWNIINKEDLREQSIDEAMWDPRNKIKCSFFKIEGKDFGPLNFHTIPLKAPIQIDAILGMEFFREHVIFLDFSENYIYFFEK